jgi:hypothetical protein
LTVEEMSRCKTKMTRYNTILSWMKLIRASWYLWNVSRCIPCLTDMIIFFFQKS